MPARGAGASARTGRHEDARAEPDILLDTRRSGACSDAPSCGASLTEPPHRKERVGPGARSFTIVWPYQLGAEAIASAVVRASEVCELRSTCDTTPDIRGIVSYG